MPKLQTKHFFPFVRMVRAFGGKQLLTEIMRLRAKENADPEGVGVEIVGLLIDRLPDAESEVMEFLALFTGMDRKALEEQPIEDTIQAIRELVADPKFLDFFKSAAK